MNNIIYEDKYIIVINKKSGLLTIGSSSERNNTLYNYVKEYVKNKNKNNKIFIVHRLDKDTSGLIVFAKDEKTKRILQDNWGNVVRKYYAVVHGKAEKEKELIKYIKENKEHISYISSSGEKAITKYYLIKNNNKYSLLDIRIYTGKKNQIRISLKSEGLPIVGDRKYGIKDNEKNMYLDAYFLEFNHPRTNKLLTFNIGLKDKYKQLTK